MKLIWPLFLILSACNYNRVKDPEAAKSATNGRPDQATMMAASLDYPSVQNFVLLPECVRCHSVAGGSQGGVNLENYQQVRSLMNRIYYRSVEKMDMPPQPMSTAQVELLKAWIDIGAPEKNIGKAPSREIKGPITWQVIRDQVLASSCLDCHSGSSPDAGLDLSVLEVVRRNIEIIFKTAVLEQTMPLQPYPALSTTEKQALMKWMSQGMSD